MVTFRIEKLEDIHKTARIFLNHFSERKIFAFYGPLGAGKTTFIKAICKEMKVVDNVNSPSFSIVNEYHFKGDGKIYHFDFYRIEKLEEVYDLGFEDYFFSGDMCLIEWPEIVKDLLPEETVHIKIITDTEPARLLQEINPADV